MKELKTITGIVGLVVTLPMWFFLMHTVIAASHPDRLVWFIFWTYVPLCSLLSILQKVADE